MALHGRRARLLLEFEKLLNLEKRSNFIKIEPINRIEGMPPEDYVITFSCRGIAGLKPDNSPRYSDFHQVSMKLSSNFPNQEPYLKWLTPIWHPNIEHKEPNHVCTNNVQNWFSTKSLDDLVITLAEMVQYQRYHAAWVAPFPLDKEAADWVVNFAEPNGLLSQTKPIDTRQILRPQKTRLRGKELGVPEKPKPQGKLKLGIKKNVEIDFEQRLAELFGNLPVKKDVETPNTLPEFNPFSTAPEIPQTSTTEEPVRRRGLTLGVRNKAARCLRCNESFSIPSSIPEGSSLNLCEGCQKYYNLG